MDTVSLAKQEIGKIEPGSVSLHFTMGDFSLIDIMRAALEQTGPADVIISTWTAGIRDIDTAEWLVTTGQIRSLRFLVDRSFPSRQPAYCRRLLAHFGPESIVCMRTHAKVLAIRGESLQVAVSSSMNLNLNRRLEQFTIAAREDWVARVESMLATVLRSVTPGVRFTEAEIAAAERELFPGSPPPPDDPLHFLRGEQLSFLRAAG